MTESNSVNLLSPAMQISMPDRLKIVLSKVGNNFGD